MYNRRINSLNEEQAESVSKIAEVFEHTTVFITGGTGFLGKLFVEKLLRTSKTVKVIMLVRPKKGMDAATRLQKIFDGPHMLPMKSANPYFQQQIRMIEGDCIEEKMGLSEDDQQMLIKEVNFIIHCAALVSFTKGIRTATHVNIRPLHFFIHMARQMQDLKGFLYVSTAYSFCNQKEIDEIVYKPAIKAEDLLHLLDMMDDDIMAAMTPLLIKDWPNTYTCTKAIAEDLLDRQARGLPVAIMRPAIVTAAVNEPVQGWVDSYLGATGLLVGAELGLLRVVILNAKVTADLIPADYVVNNGLAVLWDISQTRTMKNDEDEKDGNIPKMPIYNVLSTPESPITWGDLHDGIRTSTRKIPSVKIVWYPMTMYFNSLRLFAIMSFILHSIPAFLVDVCCFCVRKEEKMADVYKKSDKISEVFRFFTSKSFHLKNGNTKTLWEKMGPADRRLYPFSMANFDWTTYFDIYAKGIRLYVLKDPLDTVSKGQFKFKLLTLLHFTVLSIFVVIILLLFYLLFQLFV